MGEIDALNLRTNAYREAYGYKMQGANQLASARLDRMRADAAVKGGYLDAFGTILGGSAKVYTQAKSLRYI
jgi:hypothetical protein